MFESVSQKGDISNYIYILLYNENLHFTSPPLFPTCTLIIKEKLAINITQTQPTITTNKLHTIKNYKQ